MGKTASPHFLSKSLYIKGLQCPKSLWLHKFRPELEADFTEQQVAKLQRGTDVGLLAQTLYPGGAEVPYKGLTIQEQLSRTQELMKSARVIYEASFQHDGIFVKVDILRKGWRGWEIHEVKSSTGAKDVHTDDIALQHHVLLGAGVPVAKAFLVHLNRSYERAGDIEAKKLFTSCDLTKESRAKLPEVAKHIKSLRKMLKGQVPEQDIGPHCDAPYECNFKHHCWCHIPEDSVFDLAGRGVDKFSLYHQGILKQSDIPLDLLNKKQRQQVEATLQQQNTVDNKRLKEFLNELWFPLCFLDFETFQSPVPLYDGTRPYQQIPFQYSLHYQKRKGGKLYHREFLAEPGVDPRTELLKRLLEDIPEDACILTYNQAFEQGILKGLADSFPRKAKKINNIIDNLRDLMAPFRSRAIYHWQMKGSYSIKKVLPALVPEMSYEGLEIADGGAAMEGWWQLNCAAHNQEKEQIRYSLLNYCKMDTLAMVKIHQTLKKSHFC